MGGAIQQNQINNYGYAQANLLVNPGFEIWQRGTAFTLGPPPQFAADEWTLDGVGGSGCVAQRSISPLYGTYSAKLTMVGAVEMNFSQGVENYKSLEGQYLTFSMWCKTSLPNALRVRIADYDGGVEDSYSSYHSGGGGWEHLTAIKLIRTGLTPYAPWEHSFGIRVSAFLSVAGDAWVDGATLAFGNFPQGLPYIPLNPAEDVMRCERFYQISGPSEAHNSTMLMNPTTQSGRVNTRLTTRMQAVPTVSIAMTAGIGLYDSPATGTGSTLNDQANWVGPLIPAISEVHFGAYWSRTSPPPAGRVSFVVGRTWAAEVT